MGASVNRQWVLKSRPEGMAKEEHFEQIEVPMPKPGAKEVLIKSLYLSFDASQRAYMSVETYLPKLEISEVMRAFGIGQVVESNNSRYKPGQLLFCALGWQDYVVINPDSDPIPPMALPSVFDPAQMLALTITGLTGYFGMTQVGRPKSGDTVVVSGAAGATGSVAAQVAKIKGCKVIGIAGGPKKCAWLTEKIALDAAVDYKNEDVDQRLKELCPQGINVYFDNVGGEITDNILMQLAEKGSVVLCGSISQYNALAEGQESGSLGGYAYKNISALTIKSARIEGFLVSNYFPKALGALLTLLNWIEKGKLVQAIDMQEGFENIPNTLTRLFTGGNTGKQLLKVAEPDIPIKKSAFQKKLFALVLKARGLFSG